MSRRTAALAGLVAALLAPAGPAMGAESTTFQGNPAHTGAFSDAGLTTPLVRRWETSFVTMGRGPLFGDPGYAVIGQGRAYLVTGVSTLRAVSLDDGRELWARPVPDQTRPAYAGGVLYLGDLEGDVTAYDASDGSRLWSTSIDRSGTSGRSTEVKGAPVVDGGTVFVTGDEGSWDPAVVALDATTGAVLWRQRVEADWDISMPAVDADRVYVVAEERVSALDRRTGAQVWTWTIPYAPNQFSAGGGKPPLVHGGRLYARFGSTDGIGSNSLGRIFDVATGELLGTFPYRGGTDPAPAASGSTFVHVDRGTLRARDTATGADRWTFTGDGTLQSAPVIADGVVYAGAGSGLLYAVDLASGALVETVDTGGALPDDAWFMPAGLAVGEGTLLARSGGRMVAYGAATDPPLSPPRTQLSSAPARATTSTTARLTFASPTEGATFACSLDDGPPVPCTSPVQFDGLAEGVHRFEVTATSLTGADLSPAVATWRVMPPPLPTPVDEAPNVGIDPGRTEHAVVPGFGTPLKVRWNRRDLATFGDVVTKDGVGFAVTNAPYGQGRIVAVELETGRTLWRHDMTEDTVVGFDGGRLFAAARNGETSALDPATGAVLWSRDIGNLHMDEDLLAAGGVVYVHGTDLGLMALDPVDGSTLWHDAGGGPVAVDSRYAYEGNRRRDPRTGEILASGGAGAYGYHYEDGPALHDGRLWDGSNVSALGVREGAFGDRPAFGHGRAYGFSGDVVHAHDLAGNRSAWSTKVSFGGAASRGVLAVGDLVMTGTTNGDLVALDPATGSEVWRRPTGRGQMARHFSVGAGMVLARGGNGLIAIDRGGVEVTAGPATRTRETAATLTFADARGRPLQCRLDEGAWTACAATATHETLADGPHRFEVRAIEDPDDRALWHWLVDTRPPETSITRGPSPVTGSPDARFVYAADEEGASKECRLDGARWGECGGGHGYWGLKDGEHVFEARSTDLVGNVEPEPARWTWIVDRRVPETVLDDVPPSVTQATTASFAFSSSQTGASFECRLGSAGWAPCRSPHVVDGLAEGEHRFEVRGVSQAGMADPSPAAHVWRVQTPVEEPPVDEEKPPVDEEKPPVDEEKPPIDDDKTTVGDEKTAVDDGAKNAGSTEVVKTETTVAMSPLPPLGTIPVPSLRAPAPRAVPPSPEVVAARAVLARLGRGAAGRLRSGRTHSITVPSSAAGLRVRVLAGRRIGALTPVARGTVRAGRLRLTPSKKGRATLRRARVVTVVVDVPGRPGSLGSAVLWTAH